MVKQMSRAQAENVQERLFRNPYPNGLRSAYSYGWSDAKEKAYKRCIAIYRNYDGEFGGIISRNTYKFSYAFIGYLDGKKALFYITPDNDYYWLYEV